MRAVAVSLARPDLRLAAAGVGLSMLFTLASNEVGAPLMLAVLLALLAFATAVVAFMIAPHVAVAVTIPFFAFLPAIKVLGSSSLGPSKDVIVFAAGTAAAIQFLRRRAVGRSQPGDRWIFGIAALLIGLYVANPGGGKWIWDIDPAWFHGVRLVFEPLLLLIVGLTLDNARQTLRWALASLVATAVVVACIGLLQQVVGKDALVGLGYSYDFQVRSYGGERLRSFGTLDEPFAYAAFLMFAFAVVLLSMRRGWAAYIAGSVIAAGLVVSFVRGVVPIVVALIGLVLARHGHIVTAALLLAASLAAVVAFVITAETVVPSRTIQTGPSTYLTLNNRTSEWKTVIGDPSVLSVGWGVGTSGTAAERASFTLSRTRKAESTSRKGALDSGYLAIMADVGFLGLVLLLTLFARLVGLSRRAIAQGSGAGWVAAGLIAVLLIDASVRDSLTGFPTAFLGLLLVGIALAAAREQEPAAPLRHRLSRSR